jgi:hypothetical protein
MYYNIGPVRCLQGEAFIEDVTYDYFHRRGLRDMGSESIWIFLYELANTG